MVSFKMLVFILLLIYPFDILERILVLSVAPLFLRIALLYTKFWALGVLLGCCSFRQS